MSFTPLKFIYDKSFFDIFLKDLKKVTPSLNVNEFKKYIFDNNWDKRELKDRMKHISFVLNKYLDSNFENSTKQILKVITLINKDNFRYGDLAFMFLPDYIETYGINYFDLSMSVFEKLTEFTSCEFAVRPFIIQNQKKALKILLIWSKSENYHIRRLASEGCRPKLPWSIALKKLQEDPKPIIPILENLKNDSEDYVYRSVANNLNDISKDHPHLVISIAKKWKGKSKNTDWLVKHGLRTLLKQGNQEVMKLFGYGEETNTKISKLTLINEKIKIGEYLEFSFELKNKNMAINRLEYAIYFLKKNGDFGKKVFKISEKNYLNNSISEIIKKHSFKIISTRKYNVGTHKIGVIVNGIEKTNISFELKN